MGGKDMLIIVTGVCALVVFIVGFGSPYWQYEPITTFSMGLWKICGSRGCLDFVGQLRVSDWFKAVQAVECLALIGGLVALSLVILPALRAEMSADKTYRKAACALFLLAGVLGLIGVIIFGVQIKHYLHWAYGLTVVGSVGFLISAGIICTDMS